MACFAHLTTLEAVAIDLQMACQTIGPCALVRHAEDSSLAATDTHTGGGCITTRGCDLGTLLRCSLSLSLTVAVRSIALQPKSALLWILACNSHGRLEIDYHLQDVIEISACGRVSSLEPPLSSQLSIAAPVELLCGEPLWCAGGGSVAADSFFFHS
jgi:hypothetical protein